LAGIDMSVGHRGVAEISVIQFRVFYFRTAHRVHSPPITAAQPRDCQFRRGQVRGPHVLVGQVLVVTIPFQGWAPPVQSGQVRVLQKRVGQVLVG